MSECDTVRQRSRDEILSMSKERDVHAQVATSSPPLNMLGRSCSYDTNHYISSLLHFLKKNEPICMFALYALWDVG